MDRLTISPLRGLIDFWFALSYNLFIPSGLKKMTLKINHENMQAMYHFGLKILFDGYLIGKSFLNLIALKINNFLFDAYLINSRILCDGYVIDKAILFDGYLIKEKL